MVKVIGSLAIACWITCSSIAGGLCSYEYDILNRLTKITYEDGSYVEYEYDANGNITKTNVYDATPEESDTSTEASGDESETPEESSDATESGSESIEESGESTEEGSENVITRVISAIRDIFRKITDWFKNLF